MDSSKTATFEYGLTGVLKTKLEPMEWAEFLFRFVEENKHRFKHFLGLVPMRSICTLVSTKHVICSGAGSADYLWSDQISLNTHCMLLQGLDRTWNQQRVLYGGLARSLDVEHTLLLSRDGEFILHSLEDKTERREGVAEDVQQFERTLLRSTAEVLNIGSLAASVFCTYGWQDVYQGVSLGSRILNSIRSYAFNTARKRREMALLAEENLNDLNTLYDRVSDW